MHTRLLTIATTSLLLTACGSSWEIDAGFGGRCVEKPRYFDGDGDGWGIETDEMPARELCEADVESGFTSRNSRDCDDNDPEVTGRVGSACPEDLVTGDSDWVGHVATNSEFVAILDPAETVWPELAENACAYGWGYEDADGNPGGWLATFDNINQLADLQASIELALDDGEVYAGFVGITSDGTSWGWTDDSALSLDDIDACTGADGIPDPSRAAVGQHLALVYTGTGSTPWCLGTPATVGYAHDTIPEEGLSPDIYAELFGHFVCERPVPDPTEFQVPPLGLTDSE